MNDHSHISLVRQQREQRKTDEMLFKSLNKREK